ncbi:MAG: hypothetical protein WCY10_01210 [Candidatus Omnitrophota bacterium]
MTKSKRSSKNLARAALNNFCVFAVCLGLCGCFFSANNSSYTTQNIAQSLQDVALADYKTDVTARLVGSTLWVYMPVTDLFIKNPKPEKYPEKFRILKSSGVLKDTSFTGEYLIQPVPVKDKSQEYKIGKDISEKIGTLWKIIRRVMFNIQPSQRDDIKFVVMVIGDVKNGFEVKEIFYARDLKKVSYGLLPMGEFQHRVIQDSSVSPLVIGDRTGRHVEYRDITLNDFVARQIEYRISLKFQKPEVEQHVDIDKEISKIITETLRMYEMSGIEEVRFKNLDLNTSVTLTSSDIWGKPGKK